MYVKRTFSLTLEQSRFIGSRSGGASAYVRALVDAAMREAEKSSAVAEAPSQAQPTEQQKSQVITWAIPGR